jgi:hypothetical protein
MDRSKFPEGVEVSQQALEHAQDATQYHLQQRFKDSVRSGRVSGLDISIGTPETRISVSPGRAYTARGDLVESDGGLNLALENYAEDEPNYVCLFYRETPDLPQAHELNGTTPATILRRASELRIISKVQYDALPETSNVDLAEDLTTADLSGNTKDRTVIVGIVLGKGFSGGFPNVFMQPDFTNGVIGQQPHLPRVMSAITTPNTDNPPKNFEGINIVSISNNAPVGTGWVHLNSGVNPHPYRISWSMTKSNGLDSPNGIATIEPYPSGLPRGGAQILNVPSDDDADVVLTVEIFPHLWEMAGISGPGGNLPRTRNLVVRNLYDDVGQVFSPEDVLHRSKQGSYSPTPDNPHGLGYADLEQNVARIKNTLVLGEDRLSVVDARDLPRILTPKVNNNSANSYTLLWEIPGSISSARIYSRSDGAGLGQLVLTHNARWNGSGWTADVNPVPDDLEMRAMHVTLDITALRISVYTGSALSWATSDFRSITDIGINGLLEIGKGFTSNADRNKPRIFSNFNSANSTQYKTQFLTLVDTLTQHGGLRFYHFGDGYQLTVNARWDSGNSTWTKDNFAFASIQVRLTIDGRFEVLYRDPSNDPWSENDWTRTHLSISTAGKVRVGSTVEAVPVPGINGISTPITRREVAFDSIAQQRWVFHENIGAASSVRFYHAKQFLGIDTTFEVALNCRWDSAHWRPEASAAGSARLLRFSSVDGLRGFRYQLPTPPPPNDFWGDLGWTEESVSDSLRVGNLIASTGVTTQNIVASNQIDATGNIISQGDVIGQNTPRAYGAFRTGPFSGLPSKNVTYSLPTNSTVQITFNSGIPNPVVHVSMWPWPVINKWPMEVDAPSTVNLVDKQDVYLMARHYLSSITPFGFYLAIVHPFDADALAGDWVKAHFNGASPKDQYYVTFTVFSGS